MIHIVCTIDFAYIKSLAKFQLCHKSINQTLKSKCWTEKGSDTNQQVMSGNLVHENNIQVVFVINPSTKFI